MNAGRHPLFAALCLLIVASCAAIPKPSVLAEVDRVRAGKAAEQAKTHAPGAFAHAEKLRGEALRAADDDDLAAAQILGERSLAAYAHAHALARIARAEADSRDGQAEVARAEKELSSLSAEQAAASAELDGLDLKVKVVRDTQPVVPSGPADPARENARLVASRAMALQARLLCSGARLLLAAHPDTQTLPESIKADLDAAQQALEKLDTELSGAVRVAPVDEATRVRAGCLAVLTKVRRAQTPLGKAPGAGDALLSALSAMGSLDPSRDDRGVIVVLRNVFDGQKLSKKAEAQLGELAKVAAANGSFPLLVVVHRDRAADRTDAARAETVANALRASGADAKAIETVVAGAASPVVDPQGKNRAQNTRVEIIFVTPESF